MTDVNHCGGCDNACDAGQTCVLGNCRSSTGNQSTSSTTSSVTSNGSTTAGSGGAGNPSTTITSGAGGADGGSGLEVDGTCYSLCADSETDPDGDGWGWENEQSCIVVGSSPYNAGTPCGGTSAGNAGGATTTNATTTNATTTESTASTSSSTTGSGDPACGVSPVNPNATQQAQNLLCYLYEVYGMGVLSGQQETSWNQNPNDDVNWYNQNFGVYPAILGGDYLYPNGTTDRAIAYWNAGGIPLIRYHMGAPPQSDTYENSQSSANIDNVLSPGTNQNDSFNSKLDYVASELQRLEDAGAAVLWAPFHEFQPNGWFWWSKGSADQFRQLWEYMFDYLTNDKGIDNLVWLAPSSGTLNASWYPDKAFYDVGGPDTYDANPPFTSMFNQAKSILGSSVPITLHETGTIVQPSTMFPNTAPWVLFNVWAGYYNDGQHNTMSTVQSAYNSSYTITRDEVPNLK